MEKILWALILFWNVENYFAPFDFSTSYLWNASHNPDIIIDESNRLDSTGLINIGNAKEIPPSGNIPEQSRKFRNWKAFSHKRDGIAKTLCLVAEHCGRFPDLIGLAEVENRWVLKQLAQNTILAAQDYGIVHRDSPDLRGIDVALLYRRSTFRPLSRRFIPITLVSLRSESDALSIDTTMLLDQADSNQCITSTQYEDTLRTREILYVKGVLRGYDTLHVFVNHWPSKLGGRIAENHRCGIARKLNWLCDSIAASIECLAGRRAGEELVGEGGRLTGAASGGKVWHGAKIVIMGDFNAGAGDAALGILDGSNCAVRCNRGGNDAAEMFENVDAEEDGSLMVNVNDGCVQTNDIMQRKRNDMQKEKELRWVERVHGTYKYKGEWSTIDRFYVSRYFVQDKEICVEHAEVFSHPYLLEQDKTYLGVKPKRSFIGPRFNGGLSDHLPIVLRIFSNLE